MNVFQDGAELGHVEARWTMCVDAKAAAGDLAAESQALQIKKADAPE